MLKFSELSKSQKKAIVVITNHTPELKKDGRVTLKQIIAITQDIAAKRDEGAPKIGYPNWLFKHNKIERGIYQIPVPTDEEVAKFNAEMTAPKVRKKSSKLVVNTINTSADEFERSHLQKVIDDVEVDDYSNDDAEFLAELRANGIAV